MQDIPISIAAVFGTRPEAVKLLPVIQRIRRDDRFDLRVVVTGQHREMLHEILDPFGISPDVDLEIMQPGQTLNDIVCRAMPRLDELYGREPPDWVLVQGDTTSAFCAALAAFHRRIPVAHLEAGLRSYDPKQPYPEESNRRMLTAVADLHFAPTARSAQNLLSEGVSPDRVMVTGNTVIDALFLTLGQEIGRRRGEWEADETAIPGSPSRGRRTVLITMHRREAWDVASARAGESVLDGVLGAVRRAADRYPDVDFVYPVHLNPKVQEAAKRAFGGAKNARLVEPLPYVRFVKTMASASVIVTDSGGVQEEAPSLGIPVLVLRRTTERPEALRSGANRLVGTDPYDIEHALCAALERPVNGRGSTIPRPSPFGDGHASARIVQAFLHLAGEAQAPDPFVDISKHSLDDTLDDTPIETHIEGAFHEHEQGHAAL
jgi:UDP-N-acetylglucosamine 2-epimerase (non-hydrolysing)